MPFRVPGSRFLVPAFVVPAFVVPALAALSAQEPPRFRSGVDLIAVEVRVLDAQGKPVEDLRARDFTVKVDGKERDVVTAELVKVDRAQPGAVEASPIEALISTNAPLPASRRVAIGIDQTFITPGSLKPLLTVAGRFLDGLTPQDHAALVTFPEPGPRVDFTLDKARVRDGLAGVVGQPASIVPRSFYLSLNEAIAIYEKERVFFDARDPVNTIGPTMRRVLERGSCDGLTWEELLQLELPQLLACIGQVVTESSMHITRSRQEADLSIRRLESLLKELVPIEGPKTLVLISAGLLVENLAILDEVYRLAAEGRTTVHVIAVERERDPGEMVSAVDVPQFSDEMVDRQLELNGLETIADRTGGTLTRLRGGNGAGIFERIDTELSAWYVLAVERRAGDPERQRLAVEVRRRGVTVRSTRTVVDTDAINAKRSGEELLREAMGSPMAVAGLPLRAATFTQRDAATGKHRLHIAADIGAPDAPAGEYALGYVVMSPSGSVVASMGRRLTLSRPAGAKDGPLPFDTALLLDPGSYTVRFGAVDASGTRGTVVRHVDLKPVDAGLGVSDLIVGAVPEEGQPMRPGVEPRVANGRLAGYLELYVPEGDQDGLAVSLDVAQGENAPALSTHVLNVGAGGQPEWRVASGAVDVDLLPGRYVARATVRRGGETLRVLARPFVVEPGSATRRPVERIRGIPVPPALMGRTAVYVRTVVGSLSNIVAEEDFTLEDPDRRVTSDFLLVRYPGTDRDLLTFRDVMQVNGVPLAGRDAELVELFVKPITMIRDRVQRISLAAEAHVPAALNPMFVLAFFQGDYQSRFEMTMSDAGGDWPPQVKAVTFVETARPTLLRQGPFGNIDVPARGTAWIEEGTGRVLESELQLGGGRGATRITTRFMLDERLQIMVPEMMRTENPTGMARYGNFRRFRVQTGTEGAPDQR